MLSLRAVNQFYGNHHILRDLDLDLEPGQCTCVIGSPGQGKTTLVNCITGQLPVQSGSIIWYETGHPPQDLLLRPPEERAALGISYVPQERRIFSQLTPEENLHIAMMAGNAPCQRIPPLVCELFPELYNLRHTRSGELSADMQQQLALARALATQPRLLILDEPTPGSSQRFIYETEALIHRLKRDFGLTILLIEQHLPFIRRVADRFCLLCRGSNVAQGDITRLNNKLLADWMML